MSNRAIWKTLEANRLGLDTVRVAKEGNFHWQGARRHRHGDGAFTPSWSSGVHLYARRYPWPEPPDRQHDDRY